MNRAIYEAYRDDLEKCLGLQMWEADTAIDTDAGLRILFRFAKKATGMEIYNSEPATAMGRVALASAEINDAVARPVTEGSCSDLEPLVLRAVDHLIDPPVADEDRSGLIVVDKNGLPVAIRKTSGYDYLFTLWPTTELIPGVTVPAGFALDARLVSSLGRNHERLGDVCLTNLPTAPGRNHVKVLQLGGETTERAAGANAQVDTWKLAMVRPTVFALDDREIIGYDRRRKPGLDDLPIAIEPVMMHDIRSRVDAVYRGEEISEHFGRVGRPQYTLAQ
jgi:hypothetical protein